MRWIRAFGLVFLALVLTRPVAAQDLRWHSFEEALARADTTGRPVLVDVWAPWCGWCHKMKREVYPALERTLRESFVLARLNRDGDTHHRYRGRRLPARQLAQRLGAEGVPSVVLLTPDGQPLATVSGFVRPSALRPVLASVKARSPQ